MADLTLLQLILGTSGSGVIGYVGAGIRLRHTHATAQLKRESDFLQRIEDERKRVDAELGELRKEVDACRSERPLLKIVVMGAGLVTGELQRKDPSNAIFKVVADAYKALPADNEDFAQLLAQINDEPKPDASPKPGEE